MIYRYRIGDTNYATVREALARAMEEIERLRDFDILVRANAERPVALEALQRGEPWSLGGHILITPVR